MKPVYLALLGLVGYIHAAAQEFPKEFIMHLRVQSGMITNFHAAPELYTGGLQLIPQYTIVENHIRAGAIVGGFYSGKQLEGVIGPTISFKLKSIELKQFGSGGNLHVSVNHLWSTGSQRLLGGGLHADLLNFIVLGIHADRDYHHATWWFQGSIAFRLSKVKKITPP